MKKGSGSPVDRRTLALRLAAAAGGALLARWARADVPDPTDSRIDAALGATPARLSPEQRLDVRNAVRSLQKTLLDARKPELSNDVLPAFVFRPESGK